MSEGKHSRMFSFGESRRLLTASDYQRVFNHSQFKASHKHLLILASPNNYQNARLGVIVAKKHVRLAVKRNQFKRIVREQFRLQQETLPGIDLVVLARPGSADLDKTALAQIIQKSLSKIRQKAHA